MQFKIQTKLFLSLAGLSAGILLGFLLGLDKTLTEVLLEKLIDDFNQTRIVFERDQNLRYDRLVESAYLIAENSTFKANVELESPTSVYESVDEFSLFAKVDLFIVTDRDGKVLAKLGEPERYGNDLTSMQSIAKSLKGVEPEIKITWPELWEADEKIFQVVTVPIYIGDEIYGTLTLGMQITQVEAVELKANSQFDIHFVCDKKLVASTNEFLTQEYFDDFLEENGTLADSVLKYLIPTNPYETNLAMEEVFAFISPLGMGVPAFYLATIPKPVALKVLDVIKKNILIVAGIGFLLTLILAFSLGRTFSKPILNLVSGMNKVKEGDLNVELKPTTKDEIGLLTQTFNEMLIGLRERIHLMKYVGSHTIEMIQDSSSNELNLGGEKKELAVLFSDIRGFTAFSEKRTPEEVISMLNRYLSFQAEIVNKFNGSVDKFVGDEMVALFSGENALQSSIECAIEIQSRIQEEHKTDPVPIFIGIGINFGPMILGNMGAKERMDYTVIGSAVNLAARLCSAAKANQILVRKDLLEKTKMKEFVTGDSQKMSFKGFTNQLEIVEILNEKNVSS